MLLTIRIIIYVVVIASFIFNTYLGIINYKNKDAKIPSNVNDIYDEKEYSKWKEYYMENYRFSRIISTINFLVFLLMLLFGFFPFLESLSEKITSNTQIQVLLFLGMYYVIQQIIGLYPSYYDTFVIEEKFGFNKMTKKTFVLDKIKGLLLMFVLGGGLIFGLMNLEEHTGNMFFLYGWLGLVVIILVTNLIYVPVIVPMFNKLTDLEDGELKDAINDFAHSVGYEVTKISVMDASKRSTKLNAFFSGMGKFKKIVLYDTLIDKMSTDEIVSVLAHEIGHNKHKHVTFNIVQSSFMMLLYIVVLGVIIKVPEFTEAFGMSANHFGLSLLLFVVLLEPVALLISLLTSYFSRKHEYQADKFAVDHFKKDSMISALKVLGKENFVNLTPHPTVVKLTYSHPPLSQRIGAIEKL